jgi:hypothetical protein
MPKLSRKGDAFQLRSAASNLPVMRFYLYRILQDFTCTPGEYGRRKACMETVMHGRRDRSGHGSVTGTGN